MSWNISVTTVIGGGGNRPGIYAGKFSPNEFHDLPFLVKLPVGSLFLKTGEQNPDCTVGCAAGIYQKVCSDCGISSWQLFSATPLPHLVFTTTTEKNGTFNPRLVTVGDAGISWVVSGETTQYGNTPSFSLDGTERTVEVYALDKRHIKEINLQSQSLTGEFSLSQISDLTGLTHFNGYSNSALNCTGSLADAPSGMTDLNLADTSSSITGSLADAPSGMTFMFLGSTGSSITGSLADAPSGMVHLNLGSTGSIITGSLADAPSGMTFLNLGSTAYSPSAHTATGWHVPANTEVQDCALTETEVDLCLSDSVASGTSNVTLFIGGTNAAPSAAGLADIVTLQGRGWNVTTS